MSNVRQTFQFDRFDGGLNLGTSVQNLDVSETDDCLNVVFDGHRGGVTMRSGLLGVAGASTKIDDTNAKLLGEYSTPTADYILIQGDGGELLTWNDTVLTDTTNVLTDEVAERVSYAAFDNVAYFQNCWDTSVLKARKWDGTTFTTLANTFNDDYSTPDAGDMPLARLVAEHQGYMWVADTVESGTRYPHRIRFSHFAQPEDWATNDYVDVAPQSASDRVTALVSYGGTLLVFKNDSLFAVYGTSNENFVVQKVAEVGAVSQRAVALSGGICYFWSPTGQVFAFNGKGVVPISDRIHRVVRDDTVDPQGDTVMVWAGDMLWVSLVDQATPTQRYSFVYDPAVGQRGVWTQFCCQPHSLFWWRKPNGDNRLLSLVNAKQYILEWGDRNLSVDKFDGVTSTPINAYWTTPWFDAGDAAARKRFGRLRLVAATTATVTLRVSIFRNYDENTTYRFFDVPISVVSDGGVWGDNWDEFNWASTSEEAYTFDKLSNGGAAYAIKYKFSVPNNSGGIWWIDSLTIPYKVKVIR